MKLKELLPENVFELKEDALPDTTDADPWEKVMVFRKDVGWTVISLDSVEQFCKHLKHTHWTYTPEIPHD
tara:strand:+ start:606 stop:815 length:210 start_codon:yes stop_codon:yes gene_type:complete